MTKKSIADGAMLATDLIPLIKQCEEHTEDKVLFWAGFLGGIMGIAGASIGPEAKGAIVGIMKPLVEQVIDEHTH